MWAEDCLLLTSVDFAGKNNGIVIHNTQTLCRIPPGGISPNSPIPAEPLPPKCRESIFQPLLTYADQAEW